MMILDHSNQNCVSLSELRELLDTVLVSLVKVLDL